MDIISKYLDIFHIPTFGDVTKSATEAAGQAATKAVVDKASQISLPSLGSIGAPAFSSGELFGLLVIVGVLLMALTLGRTRTLVSTLSIYVAFTLQTIFPFFGWLLKHTSFTDDLPVLRVVVFFVIYAITFFLLNRSVLKARFNLGEASFSAVVLMGLAQLGFVVSIIVNLAPSFYDISSKIPVGLLPYIGNQSALFVWALIPCGLILFQKHND